MGLSIVWRRFESDFCSDMSQHISIMSTHTLMVVSQCPAQQLLRVTSGIEAKFNLIVFNPHTGTRFRASTPEAVAAFRSVLIAGGRVCTVRDSRGDDEVHTTVYVCVGLSNM